MNNELINKIIDLILSNEVEGIETIKKQRYNLTVKEMELVDNNKYITFDIKPGFEKADTSNFGVLSVMFWELRKCIPIDCILHFKDGYIHSLEVYSCDGSAFDDIDIENINVAHTFPEIKF